MCCISTLILVLLSRIGILWWWLANPEAHNAPFQGWVLPGGTTFPGWLWTLAGAIFIPWTTLAYLLLYPGGITGYEWLILVVALLIDLAGHGGSYRHRRRVIYRTRRNY
jgi:hypothetical protein